MLHMKDNGHTDIFLGMQSLIKCLIVVLYEVKVKILFLQHFMLEVNDHPTKSVEINS